MQYMAGRNGWGDSQKNDVIPLDRRVVLGYNIFVKRCRGSGVWKYGKDDIL